MGRTSTESPTLWDSRPADIRRNWPPRNGQTDRQMQPDRRYRCWLHVNDCNVESPRPSSQSNRAAYHSKTSRSDLRNTTGLLSPGKSRKTADGSDSPNSFENFCCSHSQQLDANDRQSRDESSRSNKKIRNGSSHSSIIIMGGPVGAVCPTAFEYTKLARKTVTRQGFRGR